MVRWLHAPNHLHCLGQALTKLEEAQCEAQWCIQSSLRSEAYPKGILRGPCAGSMCSCGTLGSKYILFGYMDP